MGDEREFEEARERTSGVETVCGQDPPKKSSGYGLSDQGMILSQENSNEDEELPTTAVPPTDNEASAPKYAGITQFSNVLSMHIVF